jgi:predicted amidohydrolase
LRSLAWKTLLRARAIENWAYVLGVNRRGTDGNGIFYSGDSAAANFLGETLTELSADEEFGEIIFEKDVLLEFRKRFPAYMDADKFLLEK